MTAQPPAPSQRPRVVDIGYWTWVAGSALVVGAGLLLASTRSEIPLSLRGFGALFILGGLALGFLAGRSRNGHAGYRRAALGLAFGLIALLALLGVATRGVMWLLVMIVIAVGALLMTRPAARAWYEGQEPG